MSQKACGLDFIHEFDKAAMSCRPKGECLWLWNYYSSKNVILKTFNYTFFKSLRRLVTIDYFDKQLNG